VTRARIAAAAAAILTALLLQATLVGPVCAPLSVSLPAVLVAAVGLIDGPATGLSFGFTIGLAADLGSRHPAGVLALCWLGLGLVAGTVADRYRLRRDAVTAGALAGAAGLVAGVLLVMVHRGGTLAELLVHTPLTVVVDVVLALPLVALARRMLRTQSLRAREPARPELVLGPRRG
jgi:cell shape-determining protein MreD